MSVVFYALRDEIVKKHPTQALSDIPVGKDLSNVGWQMLAWVVRDCNPTASSSTQEVLDILDAMGRGEAICQKRREAATRAAASAADAASGTYAASATSWATRAAASWATSSWAAIYATSAASDAAGSWAATYAASTASRAASASENFWKRASRKLLELYVLYQYQNRLLSFLDELKDDSQDFRPTSLCEDEDEPTTASGAIRHNKGKTRWDLLPYDALDSVAQVMTQGADKYGERNWEKGFPWMSVFSSLMRHLFRWVRGEDLDDETGLPHLSHAACNVLFLLTFYLRKSGTDDRVN